MREQTRLDEAVGDSGGALAADAGEVGRVSQLRPGPEDRDRPQQGRAAGVDRLGSAQRDRRDRARAESPDLLRRLPIRLHAGLGELRPDRADQVGVAPSRAVRRAADAGAGIRKPGLSQMPSRGSGAEGMHPHPDCRGVANDLLEQRRGRAHRGRPDGQREHHRQVLEPLSEVKQESEAGRIRQVGVVYREEQRTATRDIGAQPVEAVQQREGRFGQSLARTAGEQWQRLSGRLRQERRTLLFVRARQPGLEQLEHDAKRKLTLELPARRGQHVGMLAVRELADRAQQRRLAQAAGALDREHRAIPGPRLGEQALGDLQLAFALDERGLGPLDLGVVCCVRVHRVTAWRARRPAGARASLCSLSTGTRARPPRIPSVGPIPRSRKLLGERATGRDVPPSPSLCPQPRPALGATGSRGLGASLTR